MHLWRRCFLLLCLALGIGVAISSGAAAKEGDSTGLDHLAVEVGDILRKTNTPGAAIAIVRRGVPIWVKGIGVAEVTSNRPVTPETLFRVGSVSKMFAALAVLKLEEENRLHLDDTLRARAPDLVFTNPWERDNPVRIADLLELTAGWDDWPVSEYAQRLPSDGTLRDGLAFHPTTRTSRWPPGIQFSYSNADASAAAYVVEKTTGMTFEAYVEKTWFAPLRMNTVSYFGSPEVVRLLATSYQPDGKTAFPYWHQVERPAGSLNASVAELAHLVQLFLDRGEFGGVRLLSSEAITHMETPTTTAGARAGLPTGYGLANYATISDGRVYHGHDGTLLGYITELKYLPEAGAGYVVSINSRNGAAATAIARLLRKEVESFAPPLSRPGPASVTDTVKRTYEGWYQDDGPRFEFMHWWWRIISLSRVSIGASTLTWKPLFRPKEYYLATSDHLFRREEDPVPTVALANDDKIGLLVQFSDRPEGGATAGQTYRRIPFVLVVIELFAAAATPIAIAVNLIVVAIALLRKIYLRRRVGFVPRVMFAPAIASILAATCLFAAWKNVHGDLNQVIATATPSKSLFLGAVLILFAVSLVGIIHAFAKLRTQRGSTLTWNAFASTCILAISSGYLVYWGIAGLATY